MVLTTYWQQEKALGFRPTVSLAGSPEEQRKVLNDGCALRDSYLTDLDSLRRSVSSENQVFTSPVGILVPARIYKRTGLSKPVPGAVFFHGEGWALGNIDADDVFCRMISRDLGHFVVSVEYRLAPEHPHPAAFDDCFNAFVWVCV